MKKFLRNLSPIEITIIVCTLVVVVIPFLTGCGSATIFAQPQGLVRTGRVFHPTEGYDLVRNQMKIDHVTPCQGCDHKRRSKHRRDHDRRARQWDRDLRYQRRDRDYP